MSNLAQKLPISIPDIPDMREMRKMREMRAFLWRPLRAISC
ncbi:MAG: hypothetical protein AB1477_03050 [Acidobacteriota bacterium]